MGLFKRISDNIRANLNSLLDKAEDPVIMLDQYMRDMEKDIVEAESAVARQLVLVHKFKARKEETAAQVQKREKQALEALEKGREDLARKALEDKRVHTAKTEDYTTKYEESSVAAEKLKIQLKDMNDEYDRLCSKRDTLAARAQAAKARRDIQSVMGGWSKDNARRGFERMEEKVLQMEAEVQVTSELNGQCTDLDVELEALGDDIIEKELAELKYRLNIN